MVQASVFAGERDAEASGLQVFLRSLAMVGVAELFDKTWFMGLLLALKYPPLTVFAGSFSALLVHTVLAAAFGYAFARLLPGHVLNFVAAGLFATFALLYSKDVYMTEPGSDAIAAGREEAAEDCGLSASGEAVAGHEYSKAATYGNVRKPASADRPGTWRVFATSFMAVFIAEWGDRTQIAMVGQHASQPLMPVFWGSVVAFALLTASAVGVAHFLADQKLSERLIYTVSAVCFAVFAGLALRDGIVELAERRAMSVGEVTIAR